jgi:hypothetical protein
MLFYEVDKDALALLRAMKDYHERNNPEDAPFSEGTLLAPDLAAEHVGLETDSLRFERAVGYLVREGALVRDEGVGTVPGVDLYKVTAQGLELLDQP